MAPYSSLAWPLEAESVIIRLMKNLVLVGFMGSGKTDAGKLAAARLKMTFVDMDEIIEQRHGQTISKIFETKGETFFRRQERALVRELAAKQDQVIATGGGVVLDQNNLRDFSRTGIEHDAATGS